MSRLIGIPLGWVMWALFTLVGSYGLALLLFTVFSRLIMLPGTIRQQKSMAKMSMIQPQLQELQKKYANNREKLNEEMMALYNRAGYSPMSGCLPMALQFVVLFGIIDVIYKPLTHILRLPAEVIDAAVAIVNNMGVYEGRALSSIQLLVLREVSADPTAFASIGAEYIAKLQEFAPKMMFLGIDLMQTPSGSMFSQIFSSFNPVLLIPVLSGVTSLLLSLNTLKTTSAQGSAAGSMKGMMLVMPIFSTWFTFSVPAGVGLYWTYANVLGLVQNIVVHKVYNPKEMAEKAQKEFEEAKERERLERIEARKKAKEQGAEDDEKALSKKELNRRKLAEARRRDAEKYGETFEDVDEDDLT